MLTTKITPAGKWLRSDAAASYARMVAAAGTTDGLVSAGRTRAEQQVLYDLYRAGKGNLAAKPGTSLHESGLAIDVTRRSPLQLWMVHGSDPMKVTKAGTTRAAEYGWLRTVPSEAWHFSYDPARDRHRNDKPTVTTKPLPVPTLARVGTLNCGGWAQQKSAWTSTARRALIAAVKKVDASILSLTECPQYMRDTIRAALPGGAARWRVVIRGQGYHQAILFDSSKWKLLDSTGDKFGPTAYHGWVIGRFQQATTRAPLTVAAYHLPPNSVSSDTYQRTAIRILLSKMPASGARIVAGDGTDESSWVTGWDDARTTAKASTDRATATYKGVIRDRIHSLGLTVRRYTVIPTGAGSDHNAVLAQITIPANTTTN